MTTMDEKTVLEHQFTAEVEDTLEGLDLEKLGRQRPEVFATTWREIACVVSTLGSLAMADFTISGFQVVLPSLIEPFHIPPESQTWPSSVLTLVAGAFIFPMGRLSDMYGGYFVVNAGLIWFTIWSFIAGFSVNFTMLVLCRAMQGLGLSAFLPAGISLMGRIYRPGPRKNLIFSIYGALAPLGFYSGISVGGLTQTLLSWQWYFWIGGFISTVFTAGTIFLAPRDYAEVKKLNVKMDWLGLVTIVPGLTLLIYALTESAQAPRGWQSPEIIVTLILGVLFLSGAVYVEGWVVEAPLIPPAIFHVKYMKRMLTLLFVTWGVFSMYLFYANFYIEQVVRMSPLLTSVWFTPWAVSGIFLAAMSGCILHMLPGRLLLVISGASKVIAVLLFALVPEHPNYWAWVLPAMLAEAICCDILYTLSNVYLTTSLPKDSQGLAGAMINVTVFLGSAFFLAIADVACSELNDRGKSLAEQYHGVFWIGVVFASIALVLCFFIKLGKAGAALTADEKKRKSRVIGLGISQSASQTDETMVSGPPEFVTIRVVDDEAEDDMHTPKSYRSGSTCSGSSLEGTYAPNLPVPPLRDHMREKNMF